MKKALLIAALVVLVAAVATGVYWKWFREAPTTIDGGPVIPAPGELTSGVTAEIVGEEVNKDALLAQVQQPDATKPAQLSSEEEESVSIGNLARSFTERMASYSPTSNYDNLRQLFPLMSPSLRSWADGVIAGNGKTEASVRTSAFSAVEDKTQRTGDKRVYTVATQKEQRTTATAEPKVVYQKATVVVVKSGTAWLVDSVTWGAEGDI
ncbi:MAG: hypothetical protein AAB384_04495 [Patescibacteria group bacterium]